MAQTLCLLTDSNLEPKAKHQKTKASADDEEDAAEKQPDPEREKKDMHGLPAAEYPIWRWILMRESLDLLNENCREVAQRNPDYFDLHASTDYWNYAVLDLVENLEC